jgi:hypothetical protein
MSTELQVIDQVQSAALVSANPMDLEPAAFAAGLDRRKANRALLMAWIRSALVEGTDYGSIPTKRGPSKPSLWKPGAEKICGMLNVTVTFPTLSDYEAAALAGKKLETLIIRCELISPAGAIVAAGVGSRSVEHDYGDLNKALKMACKSAHIDATLRMGGLSEVFTQDLENGTPEQTPKTPQDAPRTAPPRTPAPAKKAAATPQGATAAPAAVKNGTDAKFDSATFLKNCKTRLLALVDPETEWAWWKYAVDKGWILPSGDSQHGCESFADATAEKMFEGYNPNAIRASVAELFDAHCTAVKAMAANCPPEFEEEIKRGFVPMPRTPDPEPAKTAAATPKTGNTCPSCSSTAIKTHDDLIGARWCQKCGTQWQEDDPKKEAYEEHEWMFAKLPFAPKDKAKPYKGLTLGQIARLDNRYWFGIVSNFKAEPFKGRPPSEESVKFGEACEEARKHLEEADTRPKHNQDGGDEESQIPF